MFFDDVKMIKEIAVKVGCSIFVMPNTFEVKLDGEISLSPNEKSVISIDQVREVVRRLNMKQVSHQFVVIRPADALGEEAANALLKELEEPGEAIHFILITDSLTKILPTILSRSAIYFLRTGEAIDGDIVADEKVKLLAKRLIVAKSSDLIPLSNEITKKKDGVRAYTLEILAVAIEMLYKSYLKTSKQVFLNKIPRFLKAYDGIAENGQIKLHLVADLL